MRASWLENSTYVSSMKFTIFRSSTALILMMPSYRGAKTLSQCSNIAQCGPMNFDRCGSTCTVENEAALSKYRGDTNYKWCSKEQRVETQKCWCIW